MRLSLASQMVLPTEGLKCMNKDNVTFLPIFKLEFLLKGCIQMLLNQGHGCPLWLDFEFNPKTSKHFDTGKLTLGVSTPVIP